MKQPQSQWAQLFLNSPDSFRIILRLGTSQALTCLAKGPAPSTGRVLVTRIHTRSVALSEIQTIACTFLSSQLKLAFSYCGNALNTMLGLYGSSRGVAKVKGIWRRPNQYHF